MYIDTFLKAKIRRQMIMRAKPFEFTKVSEDKFHQKNIDGEKYTVFAIYHENVSYLQEKDSENSRMVKENTPMLLTEKEYADMVGKDDYTMIGGQKCVVTGKTDIRGLGIVYDISLEVVQ